MYNFEYSGYKIVDANTTDTSYSYTVPAGRKLYLLELGGSASCASDCCLRIKHGSTVIFNTHITGSRGARIEVDSGETITFELANNTASSESMGAYVLGDLI